MGCWPGAQAWCSAPGACGSASTCILGASMPSSAGAHTGNFVRWEGVPVSGGPPSCQQRGGAESGWASRGRAGVHLHAALERASELSCACWGRGAGRACCLGGGRGSTLGGSGPVVWGCGVRWERAGGPAGSGCWAQVRHSVGASGPSCARWGIPQGRAAGRRSACPGHDHWAVVAARAPQQLAPALPAPTSAPPPRPS